MFNNIQARLRRLGTTLEDASADLGASSWQTFRFVTFPMIRIGMLVGFIFAFTFSFDELILAIFLTSPSTKTVPRLLWEHLNFQMTPVIAAATVVLLLATLSLLLLAAIAGKFGSRKSPENAS